MESWSISEFIREEVGDWDDEVKASARFKAFSGQRSDWEPKLEFWKDLILKVARHLGVFLIRPSEVKNVWFNRGGLTPLCLDHVLFEMYNAGDVLQRGELVDPMSGRLSQIFRRVRHLVGLSRPSTPEDIIEGHLILLTLLKDKAIEIVEGLSENHWTSSCIITMRKFQYICGGSEEASAILSYLSGCGKAQYLAINRKEFIEGVKVSLSAAAISGFTSLDYDDLHLIWTAEKLQKQLDVIDRRCKMLRNSALGSLKSGNRKVALRRAREMKLASESRENCVALLNRVEEVLRVIADAESSKKVSEAIQIGARTIKENGMSIEEVQLCLQELDESIDSQKEVDEVLESTPSYTRIEDEDIEDEFKNLELEVGSESFQDPISIVGLGSSAGETEVPETTEMLGDALSNLKLADGTARMEFVTQHSKQSVGNKLSADLERDTA
ncbi:uncharacterized protein LOC132306083 isoform X1 [Cornus florida]|uniref:uncharacterized protein LOC132306083 isoform X1 n=1 Tax=Cornus florida TaxID=4283 RepID=UPI00289E7206|nr:uncharacterized protein LOC132306083 isoform X1 [Cornus florida]